MAAVGETYDLPPPEVSDVGRLRSLFRTWRFRRKRSKLASKGYVAWYLIDGSWPAPKYVKPELDGGKIPELEYDDATYLFPKDAMLPDADAGMWVAVHREGEADPVNMREPNNLAVPADALKEYIEMQVSAEPPGWLTNFDLSLEKLLKLFIIGVIAYAVFQEVLGGGLGFL